jgi:hypothetical protein
MTGLNGYPCNKGLIVTLNGTNQHPLTEAPALITFGFALSHPLLCNFFGAQNLSNVSITQPHIFEFMLSRSPHNSDLKGLRSMRNIEIGLVVSVAVRACKYSSTVEYLRVILTP